MSVLGALSAYSRTDDWLIAAISICVAFLVIYPVYIFYLRNRHSRRIKRHLVTSAYKLPVSLSPTELAYIFSTKVSKNQIYATLLDLSNRSILIMDKKDSSTLVSMGPKIDNRIHIFEKYLIDEIKSSDRPITVEKLTKGEENFKVSENNILKGSKTYIYWWLQRQSMRERKIIEQKMTGKYAVILFKFAVVGGLLVSVVPLFIVRFMQMLNFGEVDLSGLVVHIFSGLIFWLISFIPMLVISFFLLRFRGRMLGRSWLLTSNFRRYLGQVDAFREFVRLSHKNKLRFESSGLKQESLAVTRPYAIACGYIKP